MNRVSTPEPVEIGLNRSISMRRMQGVEIACIRGCLWITEDGRLEDRILAPGQSHRVTVRDRVTVTALEPGALRIVGTPRPGRWSLAAWLARLTLARAAGSAGSRGRIGRRGAGS